MNSGLLSNLTRILVIEDDHVLRASIEDVLTSLGHTVVSFADAEAIEDLSLLEKIDIILLDLTLPGQDGIHFAQRVRAKNEHIGIIIHSARSKSSEIGLGFIAGADAYITKPASMNEICNAVQSLNSRLKNKSYSDAFSLRYNARNNLLFFEGQTVELSQKQSSLLVSFVRAKDNVLETWQIAETLGLDLDDLNKTNIELQISRLRKKIALVNRDKTSIISIRGHGYKLVLNVEIEV